MELELNFSFKGKACSCRAFIDISEQPYFIFTIQRDTDIIRKYGDDISIKTDLSAILPHDNDWIAGMADVRQAIFEAFVTTSEYYIIRSQLSKSKATEQ
jgi:hypothetical protein